MAAFAWPILRLIMTTMPVAINCESGCGKGRAGASVTKTGTLTRNALNDAMATWH